MNTLNKVNTALMSLVLFLTGCGSDQDAQTTEPAADAQASAPVTATAEPADTCTPDGDLAYICGLINAEDLLHLGDTGMLLASGMSSGEIVGHMYMIDPADMSVRELIYGGGFSAQLDSGAYPNCPGLINLSNYSIHGLSLREYESGKFDLYVTSHGAREAIEIFDLDVSGENPALQWQGCVLLPDNTFANSVAILEDGGFVTTKMMDPSVGFAAIGRGEITGLVYEWHPGGEVMEVAGTELSGANGITLSDDERYMYVAAFGSREIVKFDRSMTPVGKQSVAVDIVPDNIRWSEDGRLLTAGGNYVSPEECSGQGCATGWSVVAIDPDTLEVERVGGADQDVALQGVSTALQVGDNYWVGTFNGNRVGFFPR